MRPVVAILRARPETIADDYRRLFDLAGFQCIGGLDDPLMVVEARGNGWEPGLVCPPWQVDAVVKNLAGCREQLGSQVDLAPLLLPIKNSGPFVNLQGLGWDETLNQHELRTLDEDTISPAPFRPESLLPALEGVLPQGFRMSPHLRGKNLWLLNSMSLEPGAKLGASVALLDSLLAADRKVGGKIPLAEVLTEVVGLSREVFSSMAVVTDATIISVIRRGGARVPLVRNLLVAGTDPVAVDSVLLHLAGLKPSESPWLRLCQDRDFGVADLKGISLVGETEWLDLDFQIPEDTFASNNPVVGWSGSLWKRMTGLGGGNKQLSLDSAWSRLYRDYQSGVTS